MNFDALNETQKRILVRLHEEGRSITDACRLENISRRTYYNWHNDDIAFRQCNDWLLQNAWQDIIKMPLRRGMESAFSLLMETINDGRVNRSDRLRAASLMLEHGARLAIAAQTDQRLKRIEEALGLADDIVSDASPSDLKALKGNE